MATHARVRFASVVAGVSISIAASACSFLTSFDGLTDGGATTFVHDGGHDVEIIDGNPVTDTGVDAGSDDACAPDAATCVPSTKGGAESSLLACVNGTEQTIDCQYGCVMQTDPTRGSVSLCSPCFAGGKYCGGDKIGTDPKTLYLCNPDGTAVVFANCILGCKVNPNGDDACQ